MRSFLFLLIFLMVAPQAWALRGGPFDSTSNQPGVDPRLGTFQTSMRGRNLIGFAIISSSSSFESYGSCRVYYSGVNCAGSATGTIGDDSCLVIFNCAGITQGRGADVAGFIDMDTKSTGAEFRASGTGEASATVRGPLVAEQLEEFNFDTSDVFDSIAESNSNSSSIVFATTSDGDGDGDGSGSGSGSGSGFDVDSFAGPIRSLLAFLLSETESAGTTEEFLIRGEMVRTSLQPATQSLTINDNLGNQYPLYVDPSNVEQILAIYDTVTESRN